MIVKDVDSIITKDKFMNAGLNAEKRMAFYLQRAFKDDKDILILNGIRLESDGDSAQMCSYLNVLPPLWTGNRKTT